MHYHTPVMVEEIMHYWMNDKCGTYIDCTLGGGGHSEALLSRLQGQGHLFGFDRDPEAIAFASQRLAAHANFTPIHSRFSGIKDHVGDHELDGALYDLGVSSHQLDDGSRGFSFMNSEELDLRMNQEEGESAKEYLQRCDADTLASHFRKNSDLERAFKLAQAMLTALISNDFTTELLRKIVAEVYPHQKKDHASIMARILQSIRMEINQELLEISTSMRDVIEMMKTGANICILTYHSVEDRQVKQLFAEYEKACICPPQLPICQCGGNHRKVKKALPKPLTASSEEVKANSRARSAKLRVYQRV